MLTYWNYSILVYTNYILIQELSLTLMKNAISV